MAILDEDHEGDENGCHKQVIWLTCSRLDSSPKLRIEVQSRSHCKLESVREAEEDRDM